MAEQEVVDGPRVGCELVAGPGNGNMQDNGADNDDMMVQNC